MSSKYTISRDPESLVVNNTNNSNSSAENTVKCCIIGTSNLCMGILILFAFGLFYTLPITEFIMATEHRHEMKCDSFMSPYTWMIVEGIIGMFIGTVFSLITVGGFIAIQENENENCILSIVTILGIPLIIVNVFNFVWLIIGSIMFWRDCSNLEPESMNTLYWIVLIFGWISIFVAIKSEKK